MSVAVVFSDDERRRHAGLVKDMPLEEQVLYYKRLARKHEGRYKRLREALVPVIEDFDSHEHRARWARGRE